MMDFNSEILKSRLSSQLKELKIREVAFIVTGSVSRGNARHSGKKLISDVDVLIVVNKGMDIESIKSLIHQIPSEGLDIVYIFTLYDLFKRNLTRGYTRDISIGDILYDDLGVQGYIEQSSKASLRGVSNRNETFKSIIQEISYYYAKYINTKDEISLSKVNTGWVSLHKLFNQNPSSFDPTPDEIQQYINSKNMDILSSSLFFFQNLILDPSTLFETVRNLVFLENQGIPYPLSIIQGGV